MKHCYKCKEQKELCDFAFNKTRKDGRQSICKSCKSAYNKIHYVSTKDKFYDRKIETNKKYIQRQRELVYDYLLMNPCNDCGEKDPIVLDFDHDNPQNKLASVASLIGATSDVKLFEEIAKCTVRCANCHRKRTAKQFNWYKYIRG